MPCTVQFHDEFKKEHAKLPQLVKDKLNDLICILSEVGPNLGRPSVETHKGSAFSNMKELRFRSLNREWRVAFVFDRTLNALLLVVGNKSGVKQRQFYSHLISIAERRYQEYLEHP